MQMAGHFSVQINKDDSMKVSLIAFSTLFAIAGTVSAESFDDTNSTDARKAVPNLHDSKIPVKERDAGKGDVKSTMEIGGTEKRLRKRSPPTTATPTNLPKLPDNPATPPGVPLPYLNAGAHQAAPAMKRLVEETISGIGSRPQKPASVGTL